MICCPRSECNDFHRILSSLAQRYKTLTSVARTVATHRILRPTRPVTLIPNALVVPGAKLTLASQAASDSKITALLQPVG